jgi:hypothetical protein
MKVLAVKAVRIGKLILPGNFKELFADPTVKTLSQSFDAITQLHEPFVRKSDMLLIAGRKRVAAHHIRGDASVVVKLVECTDEEAWLVERHENWGRRHDPELQKELTEELLKRLEEASTAPTEPSGRQQTAKGAARVQAAALLGVTPGAVRKRQQRAKASDAPRESLFNPWVVLDDPAFDIKVHEVTTAIDRASDRAKAILSDLSQLAESGNPIQSERVGRVYADLREAFERLRGLRPASLCPFCKGVEKLLAVCPACLGTQYIVQSQRNGVPHQLWDEKDPMVSSSGQLLPLRDFFDSGGADASVGKEGSAPPRGQEVLGFADPAAEADPFGGLPE